MRGGLPPCIMWGATLWLSLISLCVLIWRPALHERSPGLSTALHLLLGMPFFVLAGLFIVNDVSIYHVAAFGGEALPLKYRFAATWAAREGPLLMWVGWMGLLSWLLRRPLKGEEGDFKLYHTRLRISHISTLALLLISFSLDPFKPTPQLFFGGGLNPLLQTDLMVIHPPLIFLTYALCFQLTSIGLSSAYLNNNESLQERTLTVARPALIIATVGIGLGGLWAYLILDWGGYWAWDPVETGSLLPWLALVGLVHLRTRPGSIHPSIWSGGAILTGVLAIFATTVTRAGGVWASSIHTFVTDDSGTLPDNVFGRLMVLKENPAATEIMTYTAWMMILIGCWFAVQRGKYRNQPLRESAVWVSAVPACVALIGALFFSDLDGMTWALVPDALFVGLLLLPMGLAYQKRASKPDAMDTEAWSYTTLTSLPLHAILTVLFFALTEDVFIIMIFAALFLPLYYAPSALVAWPWAAAGVVMGLSLAWSQMLELPVAALMLVTFVLPWLLAPTEEQDSPSMNSRKVQLKLALWGSVLVVNLYLVLTWVLLISSIDAINFDAHELYGAPFLTAIGVCLFLYMRRKDDSNQNLYLLGGATAVALIGALLFPDSLGADSSTPISQQLQRGHIVWFSLPFLLLAGAPVGREVVRQIAVAKKKGTLRRIPLGAHIVHFGLLLLLLGHLSTTTLVDRGDASHRLSLVKNEMIVHEGIGYEFTELLLEDEGLEVGDGFVGVNIRIYDILSDGTAKEIGDVRPGMLRFDAQDLPRSEVDTLTRLTGDIVFIFDGSQSNALMQTVQQDGLESVELVRVTIYVLPHSHAVWAGWGLMIGGMTLVALSQGKNDALTTNNGELIPSEEE